MNTPNAVLMEQARASLSNKWNSAALAAFVMLLVTVGCRLIPVLGGIAGLVIAGPMALGSTMLWLAYARGQATPLATIFRGFDNFANALIAYLLVLLFTILWMLLLIVPGIMAGFSYSMTFFIMAEDPNIKPREAIRKSKAMMYGHRMKLLFLSLRFIGWEILGLLTLGIGFLWIMPYLYVSFAKFYEDIKDGAVPVAQADAAAPIAPTPSVA
jgi:uncharacterized membrane protein